MQGGRLSCLGAHHLPNPPFPTPTFSPSCVVWSPPLRDASSSLFLRSSSQTVGAYWDGLGSSPLRVAESLNATHDVVVDLVPALNATRTSFARLNGTADTDPYGAFAVARTEVAQPLYQAINANITTLRDQLNNLPATK